LEIAVVEIEVGCAYPAVQRSLQQIGHLIHEFIAAGVEPVRPIIEDVAVALKGGSQAANEGVAVDDRNRIALPGEPPGSGEAGESGPKYDNTGFIDLFGAQFSSHILPENQRRR
jgi:hypothetical protein